ncbi:hypothetical protein NKI12_28065 [Mesorhizobium australicum]|uniref:Uncharacterized protein n=1 Tax=Mesorhizobium australicum TaxID=536018 RepID=A0ACC6T6Y0_9HYPH
MRDRVELFRQIGVYHVGMQFAPLMPKPRRPRQYGLAGRGWCGLRSDQIEAEGVGKWLGGLGEELVSKTYRPQPVRRVMLSMPSGGQRPLGIPTIWDRVVQAAAKLLGKRECHPI